ncbi:MAG: hypothetical protein RLZZ519_2994 [Bacteroidota bacterium]|jgi:hypothetical protein
MKVRMDRWFFIFPNKNELADKILSLIMNHLQILFTFFYQTVKQTESGDSLTVIWFKI